MSFGWGASDILAGIDLVKSVIEAIKSGPPEYREIHRELSSLNIALTSVQEGIDDPESLLNRKGRPRKQELLDVLANCRIVVAEVQGLVDRHSSLQGHGRTLRRVWDAYRVGSADLDTLRGRLTFYTSTIDMFLHSLEGPALARIEGMVRSLVANMGISQAVPGSCAKSSASVASTATILSILDPDQEGEAWKFLRAELMAEGILPSHLKTYKAEIIGYMKTLIAGVEEAEGSRTAEASLISDVVVVPQLGLRHVTSLSDLFLRIQPLKRKSNFNWDEVIRKSWWPAQTDLSGYPQTLPRIGQAQEATGGQDPVNQERETSPNEERLLL